MATLQSFSLKKWYLDCVSEDGRALICYVARLAWLGVTVEYSSYLYLRAPNDTRMQSRIRDAREPVENGAALHWEDTGWGLSGQWERAAPPLNAVLHETEKGQVLWNCLQPVSQCSIRMAGEKPLEGWGYVECLNMTIPPWEMGFNELRWGRFAHPDAPLVWIDLKGLSNRFWVFDGQTQVTSATIGEDGIRLPELHKTLLLNNPVVIEKKDKIREVVSSLVAWLPGIVHGTPLHFLRVKETKWRSDGKLTARGESERSGWVIHELVTF